MDSNSHSYIPSLVISWLYNFSDPPKDKCNNPGQFLANSYKVLLLRLGESRIVSSFKLLKFFNVLIMASSNGIENKFN